MSGGSWRRKCKSSEKTLRIKRLSGTTGTKIHNSASRSGNFGDFALAAWVTRHSQDASQGAKM